MTNSKMFTRYLKISQITSRYWSHIREREVNPVALFATIAHQITFSCSPLSVSLVELTKANQSTDLSTTGFISLPSEDWTSNEPCRLELDENWYRFFLKPRKLVELIKRYHCVGNKFFVLLIAQFGMVCYLLFKAIFHRFVTGTDEELAKYYADRYFPRIQYSYPNTYDLEAYIAKVCLYILLYRLLHLHDLIRNSVIHRNGYKYISITQLNLTSTAAFRLPLYKWKDFLKLLFKHHKECITDDDKRKMHLTFKYGIEGAINEKDMIDLIYFENAITFSECYSNFEEFFTGNETENKWTNGWFVAKPVMRMDPFELGWLTIAAMIGIPFAAIFITFMIICATLVELCAIASDRDQDDCLAQFPTLIFDLARLIRLFDIIALIAIQLPQNIEAALFYYDSCATISRARKVKEALQKDLLQCLIMNNKIFEAGHLARFRDKISTRLKKQQLNRSIYLHTRLTMCVYHEFRDLRRAHALFLNILMIGGGFLISISASELIKSPLVIEKIILIAVIINCSIPIVSSVLLCIIVEHTVSTFISNSPYLILD